MSALELDAVAAFSLGLLTAISPCPLVSNLAALAVLSKAAEAPGGHGGPHYRRALIAGAGFVLAVVSTYVALALLLTSGVMAAFPAASALQFYMRKLSGPLLVLAGMLLSGLLPGWTVRGAGAIERATTQRGFWMSLPLGGLVAISFCPQSAALFFGVLIPLALRHHAPILYPVLYGLGLAVPMSLMVLVVSNGAALVRFRGAGEPVLRRISAVFGGALLALGLYWTLRDIFNLL